MLRRREAPIDGIAARVPVVALLGVVATAAAFPVRRWFERRADQADLASTRLRAGAATFTDLVAGSEPLSGYVAIDDTSRERRGRARIEIAARAEGGDWVPLVREPVRFTRPRRDLAIDLSPFGPGTRIDVRVRLLDLDAQRSRLGFDLELPTAH